MDTVDAREYVYEQRVLFSDESAAAVGADKTRLDADNEANWAKRTVEMMIQGAVLRKMQAEIKVFTDMKETTAEKKYLMAQCNNPDSETPTGRTWSTASDAVQLRKLCDPNWTGIDKYCKNSAGEYDHLWGAAVSAEFKTKCQRKELEDKIQAAVIADTCAEEFGGASEWEELEICNFRRQAYLLALANRKVPAPSRSNWREVQRRASNDQFQRRVNRMTAQRTRMRTQQRTRYQ